MLYHDIIIANKRRKILKKYCLNMSKREHAQLKIYCTLFDKSINQVLRSLIARFLVDSKRIVKDEMKKKMQIEDKNEIRT